MIPRIVVVCGPTGAGKTSFAVDVASQLNGEIISADSMQVYRYMDIGTSKPTLDEQTLVFHHMIDILDPEEPFGALDYLRLARAAVKRILDRGRNVFVVGGTGFYIKALIEGLFLEESNNSVVRADLKKEAIQEGSERLHMKLAKIDKASADKIHKNDLYRIIRALEIFKVTGKTMTDLSQEHKKIPYFCKAFKIGIKWPRIELYHRINRRVDYMICCGFLAEVKKLLNAGYSKNLKSMSSLGYRQLCDFLFNFRSWKETLDNLKRDHRRYAKRQLTWFNADSGVKWMRKNEVDKAVMLVEDFLSL